MAQGSFQAQVAASVAKSKRLMKAVRDEAAQRVIEVMQTPVAAGGNMPVDTGFLRSSLMATVGAVNFGLRDRPSADAKYAYDAGAVSLVLLGAKLEDAVTAIYTANYARYQEYGTSHMQGRRFVALAAQQWPRIVSEVATEAQARAGG